MFTPENLKKLTNVSVVSHKKSNKKFELALFPNKFIEYKNNPSTPLSEILHTMDIFKNVSKGELANKKDIQVAYGDMTQENIIKEILQFGFERTNTKTRDYLNEKKEIEVLTLIREKIQENGKYVDFERLKKVIKEKGLFLDYRKESKVVANEIVKLIAKDSRFKPICMRIEIFDDFETVHEVVIENNKKIMYLSGEEFAKMKDFFVKNGYRYVILQNQECEEEDIC